MSIKNTSSLHVIRYLFLFGVVYGLALPLPCYSQAALTPLGGELFGLPSDGIDQAVANSLLRQAEQLESTGAWERALAIYRRLYSWGVRSQGQNSEYVRAQLLNIAGCYRSLGKYSQAEEVMILLLSIVERSDGADNSSVTTPLNNLGLLYQEQGKYISAESLLLRSLKIREKAFGTESEWTANSLNNLAQLYAKMGLIDQVIAMNTKALGIRQRLLGEYSKEVADSLNNLANVYTNQGMYSKAEPLYLQSLQIRERLFGGVHGDVASSLQNLALMYTDKGLYSKAEPLLERALSIETRIHGDTHPETADAINNLAFFYLIQEKFDNALPHAKRVYEIRGKTLGAGNPETASALANLASIYFAKRSYLEARSSYAKVLAIHENSYGLQSPYVAQSSVNLAAALQEIAEVAKAEGLYLRALDIYGKSYGEHGPYYSDTLARFGRFYSNRGLHAKAEPLYRHALELQFLLLQRESALLPRSERIALADQARLADDLEFSSVVKSSSGANLALFSRLNRQGLLEEIEKRQAQLASLPGAQQEVALELKRVTQQLSSISIPAEKRKTLKARQEELERQHYRLLPELKPRIVEVEQVAAVLPKDGALVEYQRYRPYDGQKKGEARFAEARYLALVLKPDASIKAVDLGLAAPIDQRIQLALMASEQKLGDAQALWDQVGSQIINPLASALSGVQTLFISPDGELNRIPFAALPAPGGQQLLAEAMKLRLLTTGRELLDLAKPSVPSTNPALVVANPAFDQRAAAGSATAQGSKRITGQRSVFAEPSRQRSADLTSLRWDPLPGTAEEGAAIAALTKGKLLSGAQASASAIQASAAPQVLHIASHAFFLPDVKVKSPTIGQNRGGKEGSDGAARLQGESPLLRSGIALAGANQAKAIDSTSDTADDGYLTALEVAQLDWKGTELVVISACESGTGDIQAGEGVYGLKRAIAVAGARSSLLSLWKVDDKATAAFMESFYQKLKAGQSRADALAATQKEFREHPNKSWRHPYVWAAFQLSGDWRAIHR